MKRFVALCLAAVSLAVVTAPVASAARVRPAEIKAQIRSLSAALNRLAARLNAAEERLDNAGEALLRHRRALRNARSSRSRLRASIAGQAAELYKLGGGAMTIDMMLTKKDPRTLIQQIALLQHVRDAERAMLESVVTVQHRSAELSKRYAKALSQSRTAYRQLRSRRAVLDKKLREYESLLRFVNMAAGRTVLRSSRSGAGGFVCPVAGARGYSNSWGAPRSGGPHTGIDIQARHGTPVVAVLPGRVLQLAGGGWIGIGVILRDALGNDWWYAHLSSTSVHVGERVVPGMQIGRVGCTGTCTGPHLHFEYHPGGGAPQNPYRFIASAC